MSRVFGTSRLIGSTIKSSLGRPRTRHSLRCGVRERFKARSQSRSPKGLHWTRRRARDRIRLLHPTGSWRGSLSQASIRYLIWPLSEPRVAVFWPGIVLRGFTFISILITRSLGSRFGTRYPSTPCIRIPTVFLFSLLPLFFFFRLRLSSNPLREEHAPSLDLSFVRFSWTARYATRFLS